MLNQLPSAAGSSGPPMPPMPPMPGDPPVPPHPGDPPIAGRVFHALGDATRMAMVEQLSGGPRSVSELARPLGITLPGVLQHLAVLESDGLVRSEKVGRVRTCRIEPAALRAAGDWVAQRRRLWEHSLDRLGEYLDRQAAAEACQPPGRARRADSRTASARSPKPTGSPKPIRSTRPTKERP